GPIRQRSGLAHSSSVRGGRGQDGQERSDHRHAGLRDQRPLLERGAAAQKVQEARAPRPRRRRRLRRRIMRQYLDLLETILERGGDRRDRTGTGTRGIFGHQMRFDLRAGFPLLTTKRLPLRAIAHELFWFLRGETNAATLQAEGVKIWDEWA